MNVYACKGCIYFSKYYGEKDGRGKPKVSKYWCVKRQNFMKHFPKQCEVKEERKKNERN